MSDFYRRLDEKERDGRIARIFANRPENLHDYQGCANDAASRLPETKLPSSPAGEIASLNPMKDVPKNASWFRLFVKQAGDVKEYKAHWASNLSGEEQPAFQGFYYEVEGMRGFQEVPGTPVGWLPIALPDPLGDISGPKGSGGAAPEAAEDKCILCFGEGGEYHAELRSGRHLYGLCEECADLWDGSAEEPQLMTRGEKIVPAEDGADYFTHPRSAAPIAPAAQEVVPKHYEITRSFILRERIGWLRTMTKYIPPVLRAQYEEYLTEVNTLARAERKEGEAKHG